VPAHGFVPGEGLRACKREGRASAGAPLVTALFLSCVALSAAAQSVSMGGSLGSRALLVIDGKAKQLAVGSTVDGVRLVSVSGNDAVVEVQGKRVTLQLGGAPASLGGTVSEGTARQIVLTADGGGPIAQADVNLEVGTNEFALRARIDHPELWWPNRRSSAWTKLLAPWTC